jgi:hypothetical protein
MPPMDLWIGPLLTGPEAFSDLGFFFVRLCDANRHLTNEGIGTLQTRTHISFMLMPCTKNATMTRCERNTKRVCSGLATDQRARNYDEDEMALCDRPRYERKGKRKWPKPVVAALEGDFAWVAL